MHPVILFRNYPEGHHHTVYAETVEIIKVTLSGFPKGPAAPLPSWCGSPVTLCTIVENSAELCQTGQFGFRQLWGCGGANPPVQGMYSKFRCELHSTLLMLNKKCANNATPI